MVLGPFFCPCHQSNNNFSAPDCQKKCLKLMEKIIFGQGQLALKLLRGQKRQKGLTFEPLYGFSNFKSLNW